MQAHTSSSQVTPNHKHHHPIEISKASESLIIKFNNRNWSLRKLSCGIKSEVIRVVPGTRRSSYKHVPCQLQPSKEAKSDKIMKLFFAVLEENIMLLKTYTRKYCVISISVTYKWNFYFVNKMVWNTIIFFLLSIPLLYQSFVFLFCSLRRFFLLRFILLS